MISSVALNARLSKDKNRVLCGVIICPGELGAREAASSWLGDDGEKYRSPYYGVSLPEGYHFYPEEDLYRLTPRARKRLQGGRRPTHRRGAVGPTAAGTYVGGRLSPFGLPAEGTALVECPRCRQVNVLPPDELLLVDWSPDGTHRIELPS